jgi:hypothetical protein
VLRKLKSHFLNFQIRIGNMLTNTMPEGVNNSIAVESNVVCTTPKVTATSNKHSKGKKAGE